MKSKNEGWAYNITEKGGKTHYYKDGISLCGKRTEMPFMNIFDKERNGSKYFEDCPTCIKKLNNIKQQTK